MKGPTFPQTDSIEELASFWDSHSVTAFEDQMEEVSQAVFERRHETVMVLRLEPGEVQAVQAIARARGVEEDELLREWVREKLGSARG